MRSVDNFQHLFDIVPTTVNGIILCQGNFTLMTDDLPTVIRHFGNQQKIFFVHLRDVIGQPEKFQETFHDDGKTGIHACLEAHRDIGFDGSLRPRSCTNYGWRRQRQAKLFFNWSTFCPWLY